MRKLLCGLILAASSLSFATEPTFQLGASPTFSNANGNDIATRRPLTKRGPDRSPILRSFDARMKLADPYAIQQVINRRTLLKW